MRTPSVAAPRPTPWKRWPAQAIDDEPLPTRLVGLAKQHGVAVFALRREALGIDDQELLARLRGGDAIARGPVDPPPEARRRLAKERSGVEEPVERLLDHLDDGGAALVAGVEAAVVEQGQQLDGRGAGLGAGRSLEHRPAEPPQLACRPRGQILHQWAKRPRHVALAQLLRCRRGRSVGRDLDAVRPGRSQRTVPPSSLTSRPNLSVQERPPGFAVAVRRHGEDEGAAVGAGAAARVPVLVGHGAEARVLLGQAAQGGVDGLLLGADQADLDLAAVGKGEDLRAQHGRVGDAQQLELVAVLAAGDDEEPGTVRRGVNVGRLDLPVDDLLFRRQLVEIELGGGGQGLDDVLQRVLVDAVPQVEELDRYLGVGEELLADVALAQVLADRVVVGEVAVVDQGLVQADERVRARRGATRGPWWDSAGGRSRRGP